jgi:hypothetical protein
MEADSSHKGVDKNLSDFGIFCCGALSGCVLALVALIKGLHMNPGGAEVAMSQVDVVLIVLAAVTVLLTALGVIIAVAAIWGMTGLRRTAHDVSKATATAAVERSLSEGGELYKMAQKTFADITYRETGLDESSGIDDPVEDYETSERTS